MSLVVRHATIDDVDRIVPLFDAYRQFYGQASDLAAARDFLAERLGRQESLVLLAVKPSGEAVGFTQLYPTFSSVRVGRIYVLNDLFVAPQARRHGVALQLLAKATEVARSLGAVRLSLSTALSNTAAQKLYESQGWQRDVTFCHYDLRL